MASSPVPAETGGGTRRMSAGRRREQLLDVTLALATEHGFGRLSIEAIAREAGITRPVVYGVLGDLPHLLHELHERETQRALTQLAAVEPTGTDPDRAVVDALGAFLAAVAEAPATWRLVLLPADGMPEALRERMLADRALVLQRIEELVLWGLRARGGLGADGPEVLDSELLALFVRTLGEEAGRLLLTEPERFPIPRLVGFAERFLAVLPRGTLDPADAPPPLVRADRAPTSPAPGADAARPSATGPSGG